MGNIEDSTEAASPPKKVVSDRQLKPHPHKKPYKTDIPALIPSSRLACKVQFTRFIPKPPPEIAEDDFPEEEWTLGKQQPCAEGEVLAEESLLENLLQAQVQGRERIGVNWSSFVKIKKRNYLQEYAFIKELGKGAFGLVAKVKMKYGAQFRAVKVIKQSPSLRQEQTRKKLLAEISIPIELDHPNIAKLFQVFECKSTIALIMELCEGGDLFAFIRANRIFTESSAAGLLKQIMSAVYYMHKRGVVHRDLKPENMLYDNQSGLLKIIDFGTAARFQKGEKFSVLAGTPYYVAPQVVAGRYDQKCDIWSVGVILYVILSGGPPFSGRNEKEIMERIRLQPLQFSSPIWNKRSVQCKELLVNMLRKDPQARLTAQQVLASPWFEKSKKASGLSDPQLGRQIIGNLKNFHFQNKLKAVVYTYIASQLYSNKDKQILLKAFKEIDADGDGVIQRDELVSIFQNTNSTLQPQQVSRILQLIDTNGSGRIDFTEFLVAASNEQQLLKKKQLESAFSYLDTDHSGYITFEEVQAFLDGTEQTSEEIRQIFKEVDENGDGSISKNEFVALLLGPATKAGKENN